VFFFFRIKGQNKDDLNKLLWLPFKNKSYNDHCGMCPQITCWGDLKDEIKGDNKTMIMDDDNYELISND